MKKVAKRKRKIAIIAGSRGEYGYFRPILKEIAKSQHLDYGIIATSMHVLDRFGSSIEEIKKDRFKIVAAVHNTFDGYNRLTMAKSLSVFMLQLPEMLEQMEADMILLAGDRGEQLMAAIVGAHMYLPVAHIQAGEVSGNIDGTTRHAITKFSHLHFASNTDAAQRVRKMGEEPFRIFTVGAPQLDELVMEKTTADSVLRKKLNLETGKPIVLIVQHPVTEEFDQTEQQIACTLQAVRAFDAQVVVVLSNADAGSHIVHRVVSQYQTPMTKIFPNLPRKDYLGLLKIADVLVGNSSSGIIEAPIFKLPAINIGSRQKGRLQSSNVINVRHSQKAIERAIKTAMTPAFRKRVERCVSPYGDGNSSKKIVNILETVPFDEKLLVKRITY